MLYEIPFVDLHNSESCPLRQLWLLISDVEPIRPPSTFVVGYLHVDVLGLETRSQEEPNGANSVFLAGLLGLKEIPPRVEVVSPRTLHRNG
jgi:hypothetical protein